MVTLKYKIVHDLAKEPTKGSSGAACFDLYAATCTIGHYFTEYDTGLALEISAGYVGLVYARSSVSQTGLWLANGVGVIDADYRGPVKVRFYRSRSEYYDIGDRVAQLMIVKLPDVTIERIEQLSTTDRGAGSFGSTGKN